MAKKLNGSIFWVHIARICIKIPQNESLCIESLFGMTLNCHSEGCFPCKEITYNLMFRNRAGAQPDPKQISTRSFFI